MTNHAASDLGKLSAAARLRKWGKSGFRAQMSKAGKLGGRPRLYPPCTKGKSHKWVNGSCSKCNLQKNTIDN